MSNLYNKKCQCTSCADWRRGFNAAEADFRCEDRFRTWKELSFKSESFQNGYSAGEAKCTRELDDAFHRRYRED